jgi:AcrR family transcriptional regulator
MLRKLDREQAMTENEITTEQRIITAAVECIERYGIQETTNRKIAEIAGVNNAAINYYFRSKDALVQRVMQETLNNAFDWEDFSKLPYGSPRERCIAVFSDIMTGGINFPGITRAHFYELFANGDYNNLGIKKYTEFVERLARELEDLGAAQSPIDLRLALMQIAAAVMMVIIAPGMYADQFQFDMRKEEDRVSFITTLVKKLL